MIGDIYRIHFCVYKWKIQWKWILNKKVVIFNYIKHFYVSLRRPTYWYIHWMVKQKISIPFYASSGPSNRERFISFSIEHTVVWAQFTTVVIFDMRSTYLSVRIKFAKTLSTINI